MCAGYAIVEPRQGTGSGRKTYPSSADDPPVPLSGARSNPPLITGSLGPFTGILDHPMVIEHDNETK